MMLMSERETAVLRERTMTCTIPRSSGECPRKLGQYVLIAGLLALLAVLPCPVRSETQRSFVMVTDQPEDTYEGKWQRLVYQEAFRRLDIPLEVEVMPTQRLSAMVDSGAVDGQFMRVAAYAGAHPEQVRVDEVIYEVGFALWVSNPALTLTRLQDLAATGWVGAYRRGVELCQRALSPLVPAERLSNVATEHDGLRMLLNGRIDYYCEIDAALQSARDAPEFKGAALVRPLLTIGDRIVLYPYLHKNNAVLSPRLAAVLKGMKAEGLLERFQREALGR
jgi:polar amino acid transport system substrate-binding protein